MTDAPIETTQSPSESVATAVEAGKPSRDLGAAIARAEAKAEAKPKEPAAETPEATKPDTESPDKLAIAARRAQRQAEQVRKQLDAEKKAAAEEIRKAKAEAEEIRGMLKNVRTKEGFEAFLKAAGVEFNDIAMAHLGLDPDAATTPEAKKLADIEKRLAEKEAKEKADLEALETQRLELNFQRDVEGVHQFVLAAGDKYELILDAADRGSIARVVKNANKFLSENGITSLTDPERIQLLDFFCEELETDLFAQAQAVAARFAKLKKLNPGITPHTDKPSDSASSPSSLKDDPKTVAQLLDTKSARPSPSTKFLTNDETISPPSVPATRAVKQYGSGTKAQSRQERLEKLIEQYR